MPIAVESAQLPELTTDELSRRSRHLILPEVVPEGRRRALVNLYWNDQDARNFPQREAVAVTVTGGLSILPSIARGLLLIHRNFFTTSRTTT